MKIKTGWVRGGINHKVILSEKTYLNTSLAATGNFIYWHRDRLNTELQLYPKDEIEQNDRKYTFSVLVNHKFGAHHTNRTGLVINRLSYDFTLQQYSNVLMSLNTYADENGSSELLQFYSQSRFDILHGLSFNMGIHSQRFSLNNEITIEPRTAVKWNIANKHTITIAYGLHSRLEPISYYFVQQTVPSGIFQPNKDLRLTKSHHFVLAYERVTGEFSKLRIEPFYQCLYDVPVIPRSSYSMMNLETDWFFNDSLVNTGTGTNYGLDITLERFLHTGYYYLITGSLFNASYKGGDNIERNARFNKNYVVNFLFGKEWLLGRDNNNTLGLGWKFSLLGGDRISPVDNEASIVKLDVVYDENKAYSKHKPAVYYLDFSASWQRNRPKYSTTWSLQFVNLLFQKEFYGHRFNFKKNQVESLREIIVIPNISYRIDF